MAVPVALGKTFFDTTALKNEHVRLAQELLRLNPRDAMDPAQDMIFSTTINGDPRRFVLYAKSYYDKAGDQPTYGLYFKDDTNTERSFPADIDFLDDGNGTNGSLTSVTMVDIDGNAVTVNDVDSLMVDANSGRIYRNNTAGEVLGVAKFEAVAGLQVAQINARLADVNNALDALTKVLTVLNSNLDAGISLIR